MRPTVVERGSPASSANWEGENYIRLRNGSCSKIDVQHNSLALTDKRPSVSFTAWNIPVVGIGAISC